MYQLSLKKPRTTKIITTKKNGGSQLLHTDHSCVGLLPTCSNLFEAQRREKFPQKMFEPHIETKGEKQKVLWKKCLRAVSKPQNCRLMKKGKCSRPTHHRVDQETQILLAFVFNMHQIVKTLHMHTHNKTYDLLVHSTLQHMFWNTEHANTNKQRAKANQVLTLQIHHLKQTRTKC